MVEDAYTHPQRLSRYCPIRTGNNILINESRTIDHLYGTPPILGRG
jgi:hypothetical protein